MSCRGFVYPIIKLIREARFVNLWVPTYYICIYIYIYICHAFLTLFCNLYWKPDDGRKPLKNVAIPNVATPNVAIPNVAIPKRRTAVVFDGQ